MIVYNAIQGIQCVHDYMGYTGSTWVYRVCIGMHGYTWVYRVYMSIQGIQGIHENGHSLAII